MLQLPLFFRLQMESILTQSNDTQVLLNHYQTALIEILQSAIYSFLVKIMRNGPVHQYWLIL